MHRTLPVCHLDQVTKDKMQHMVPGNVCLDGWILLFSEESDTARDDFRNRRDSEYVSDGARCYIYICCFFPRSPIGWCL
jgi:hypothetical protein